MILWGDTLPRFYLCTKHTEQDTATGNGATQTFSFTLDNTPVLKKQVSITVSYDSTTEQYTDNGAGNLTSSGGGTGTINYSTGEVTITLAGTPADGSTITFSSVYYSIDYDFDFANAGVIEVADPEFVEVEQYSSELVSGAIRKKVKHRGIFGVRLVEVAAYTYTDEMRQILTWHDDNNRAVVMFPRPGYLPGYFVVPKSNFKPSYPNGVYKAVIIEATFVTVNVFDNIPGHTGAEGDTVL